MREGTACVMAVALFDPFGGLRRCDKSRIRGLSDVYDSVVTRDDPSCQSYAKPYK